MQTLMMDGHRKVANLVFPFAATPHYRRFLSDYVDPNTWPLLSPPPLLSSRMCS